MMVRRLLDAILRGVDEPPGRPLRPNELRRDTARAERLRLEALRAEAATSQPGRPPEERREQREPNDAPPRTRPAGERRLVTALMSRSGLRQAWLLKEILGPPRAVRGPYRDGPDA